MGILKEVEKLRGLAITAVVVIHATAPATVYYPGSSGKYFFYNILNSLVQFAVPLFLFISSFILSWKYNRTPEPLVQFYRKRVRAVLLPYILWSVLYGSLKRWANDHAFDLTWIRDLGWDLWTGNAFYHLYFFQVILQLYLLVPCLVKLVRSRSLGHTLTMAALFQIVFYLINKAIIYRHYPYPAHLLGSYLPAVLAGCWLGINYEQYQNREIKLLNLIANLVMAMLFAVINTRLRSGQEVNTWLYYTIYHLFVTLTSWNALLLMRKPILETTLITVGRYSFAIYLVHPLFLAAWERLWFAKQSLIYDIFILTSLVFAMAGSCAFGWLLSRKPHWRKLVLGR